ncbi:hypothetical protein DFJ73DRAFT_800068 [Zopfochytrium polystomum]|nr:hypothetical protein DFJ73DRAFT_800068 [Zopfochytrium polystomum]
MDVLVGAVALQDWTAVSGVLYPANVSITPTTPGTPFAIFNLTVKRDPTSYIYVTKMDVFTLFAFVFVFIALVEFAIVHFLKISGNVLLSKSIESFFRNTSSITLILVTVIVSVGFGDLADGRKVMTVVKHGGEVAKARAKKKDDPAGGATSYRMTITQNTLPAGQHHYQPVSQEAVGSYHHQYVSVPASGSGYLVSPALDKGEPSIIGSQSTAAISNKNEFSECLGRGKSRP